MVNKFKGMVLQTADDFRIQVRRHLNRDRLETFFAEERPTAFGFAGGAIAGVVL